MRNNAELPSGWVCTSVGEVVASDGIFTDGDWVETKDQDPNGDVRLIQLADIGDGSFLNKSARYLTRAKALELNCTFLRKGDLLVARMPEPLGRCCVFPLNGVEKYVTVVDVCAVRLGSSSILSKFLMYVINSPRIRTAIEALKSGSTRKRISRRNLSRVEIPVAPQNEQLRIVAKIQQLFSELDKGIESLQRARAELNVYRQAVLKHAFEGKLTARWREQNKGKLEKPEQLLARIKQERTARYEQQLQEWKRSSAQWYKDSQQGLKPKKPLKPKLLLPITSEHLTGLPPLPSGWQWVRIGEIGLVGTGVTPLKSKSEYYVNGCVPWVTSGALNDPFVCRPTGYVTEAALNETNLRVYAPHTLVVALYGEGRTRGKCSELLIEATTNQAIAAIVQDGAAIGLRGLLKWFLTKNYEEVRTSSSGGVQPNLNLGIIENSPVPMCSIAEAKEIEKLIKRKFAHADKLDELIVARLRQSDVLRQAILKKAFSGQLIAQDPDDEPASVLLERIKAERKKVVTNNPPRKTMKRMTCA